MMPPFSTPGKASYFWLARHSATTSSPFTKLRTCRPSALAGPQPKQALWGANSSCKHFSLMGCLSPRSGSGQENLGQHAADRAAGMVFDRVYGARHDAAVLLKRSALHGREGSRGPGRHGQHRAAATALKLQHVAGEGLH